MSTVDTTKQEGWRKGARGRGKKELINRKEKGEKES